MVKWILAVFAVFCMGSPAYSQACTVFKIQYECKIVSSTVSETLLKEVWVPGTAFLYGFLKASDQHAFAKVDKPEGELKVCLVSHLTSPLENADQFKKICTKNYKELPMQLVYIEHGKEKRIEYLIPWDSVAITVENHEGFRLFRLQLPAILL